MKKFEITLPLDKEEQKFWSKIKFVYCKKNNTGSLAVWDETLVINQDNLSHLQKLVQTAHEELPSPQAPEDREIDYYDFVDRLGDFLHATECFANVN